MKKLLLISFLFLLTIGIKAQTFNNLIIHGFVTEAPTGLPVTNHIVTAYAPNDSINYNATAITDTAGFYSLIIEGGSVTGPNQVFLIKTLNCTGEYIFQDASNLQGTVDEVNRNFELCSQPPPPVCNALFTINITNAGAIVIPVSPLNQELSYSWTLSNGLSIQGYDLFIPISEIGQYGICLGVSGPNCEVFQCDTIILNTNDSICNPNFENNISPSNPLRMLFTNTTNAGNSASYVWNFGDGTTEVSFNAEHTYTSPGVYNVCLTISGNGCTNTYCRVITVTGNDVQCDASFTYVNDGTMLFINSNYPNISNYSHQWIVGNDVISTEANPSVPIISGGNQSFELCHFITGPNGCSDQFCSLVTIDGDTANSNCQAYFTYHQGVNNPNVIAFIHQSLIQPDSDYTATWDYGDGTTATGLGNQEHLYALSGYYTVCLMISSATCQNTFCAFVYAGEQANNQCDAGFQYFQLTEPGPIMVQFHSNLGFNQEVQHFWNFGNGETSTEANPIALFNQSGEYNVSHVVSSLNWECTDSVSYGVYVNSFDNGSICSAYFNYQQEFAANSVTFYPNTLVQLPFTYIWNFGDGETSFDPNPTHTYDSAGVYEVCLTVSFLNDTCINTYCTQVYVYDVNANLYLFGQVFAGANYADEGTAYLIQQDVTSGSMTILAETPISQGHYYFQNVAPGTYFVKASLSPTSAYYSNYVPTYFGSQYYWELAEPIELNANNISQIGYTIALIYSTNPGGPGEVGGNIDDGPFKISAEGINPIANATVVITNLNNVPQRWTKTDASGNFFIGNIAYGTYRLMADVAGMPCIPIEFTLSPETPSVNITLMMGFELTGIVKFNTAEISGELFPSPASETTSLKLNLRESKQLSFTLTTITGQTVWSQNQKFMAGAQTITIPVNELSGGVYLLSLRDTQSKLMGVRRLIIAR